MSQQVGNKSGRLIDRKSRRFECAERRRMQQTCRRLGEQLIITAGQSLRVQLPNRSPERCLCLRQCRHPAQFLLRYYQRGATGGLRLGARHGLFCVGCCWALMLVMFAVGVASLVWMGLLTAVMVHEKTRPLGQRAVPVTGVALLAAASILAAYAIYAATT